ncbi:MAG: hypothetical protein IKP65_06170 [Alphaproteobacteria bacterium]|nr:hypothetical protein [Alphaproteobacteria bacterium]
MGDYLDNDKLIEYLTYLIDKNILKEQIYKKYLQVLSDKSSKIEDYWNAKSHIYSEYIKSIILQGKVKDYIWLSEVITKFILRAQNNKEIIDARNHGINPFLLITEYDENSYKRTFPKEYDYLYYYHHMENYEKETVQLIYLDNLIRFKKDIDNILSSYYPVPNFLNHAIEIIYSYEHFKNAYGNMNLDTKLETLSPYQLFGFTVAMFDLGYSKILDNASPQSFYINNFIYDNLLKTYTKSIIEEITSVTDRYNLSYIQAIEKAIE